MNITLYKGALIMTLQSECDLRLEILGLIELFKVWYLMNQSYLNCADINNFLSGMRIWVGGYKNWAGKGMLFDF